MGAHLAERTDRPGPGRHPHSLASNGAGRIVALVGDGRSSQVLTATDSLSTWQTAATEAQLAATPAGRRCGLTSLTAVAYPATTPMAAGSCSKPGITAVFALRPPGWQAAGPPTSANSTVQVLGLRTEGATLTGLFATTTSTGTNELVAGWSNNGGQQWKTSPPLQLGDNRRSLLSGRPTAPACSCCSPIRPPSKQLDLITGPSSSWSGCPNHPLRTATLAITPGSPAPSPGRQQYDPHHLDPHLQPWRLEQKSDHKREQSSSDPPARTMIRPGYRRRRARPTQINCDAVQEAISAALDNETAELDAKTIRRHLDGCPRCQQFREAWQETGSQAAHLVRQLRLGPVVSPPSPRQNEQSESTAASRRLQATPAPPPQP